MASAITVPRLGWNMEQGVFMGWLKRDGDPVRAGEPLFTLEGDKAVQEIEALDDGVLHIAANGPAEGDAVAVGALLGQIETSGKASASDPPSQRVTEAEVRTSHAQPAVVQAPPRPDRRRRAISPRARRAARQLGIDPVQVRGTGREGRIRERDIVDLTLRVRPTAARPVNQEAYPTRSTATLTTTADATNLVSLRAQLKTLAKTREVPVFTYTDLFAKLVVIALKDHPRLNARWRDGRIETCAEIHVGIAVDTGAGLVVPVVRDAHRLTLRQLVLRTQELAEKARLRQLTPEDLQGATFAVANLGGYGIDAFKPAINGPQCAALGIGRIRKQPAVVNHRVVPRDLVTLSLAADPRLVNGAAAARFLQTLGKGIENPVSWLFE